MTDYLYEMAEKGIERFSEYEARVIGVNSCGCYIELIDSGVRAFYYGGGETGDTVYVTVYKIDSLRQRVTCNLDSVISYASDEVFDMELAA